MVRISDKLTPLQVVFTVADMALNTQRQTKLLIKTFIFVNHG